MSTTSTRQNTPRYRLRNYAVAFRKRADGNIVTFEMMGTVREVEKALFNQGVVATVGGRCAFGFNDSDKKPQVVSFNDKDSQLHASVIHMLEARNS